MSLGGTTLTPAEICNAIESTIGTAIGALVTQSYDELTEGVNETPTMQVYPMTGEPRNETAQSTYGRGIVITDESYAVDIYTRQRSQLAEDMESIVDMIPLVETVLEAQKQKPFGVDGLKAHNWSWDVVTFEYAGIGYAGVRFMINVVMY